jgi:UDP-N-acetylglucosamine acyltransferase
METETTQVHPSTVIAEDVQLGNGVIVGPNCSIDSGVSLGDSCVLEANVVIGKDVRIGSNNRFYPNCVIGGRPQILMMAGDEKIGGLEIGDGNTFREQVTIHPSMHPGEFTRIGNNNLLMIGVHIGHDTILEDQIVMSNYAQISGHCKIGTGVWLSGMVLLHQFVTVGRWCYAAGLAGINHDVPPFLIVSDHYPLKVRGVNKRGLARAGLGEQEQENVLKAYKVLYRSVGTLLEKAMAMAAEDGLDDNVREMVDMIIKSSKHRFGRHLETFRH